MTPEFSKECRAALKRAVAAGEDVLHRGGAALDAAIESVNVLEDEPLFNAGRGAVFTTDVTHEMDAAVMDGASRRAGAVAGIFGPRNPVTLARAVMERTDHVLLIGSGALRLARDAGLPFEEPPYFYTERRRRALEEALALRANGQTIDDPALRHGTVGAVARDRSGNLAAATSTGGVTGKLPGRVGDTPVIGAGTFADNRSCAVSATGDGEAFIRLCVAHEIDARVRLAGQTLEQAAAGVVMDDLTRIGGSGGVIAVDARGNVTTPFNCEGMYRGWVVEGDTASVAIYHDE